ncbi:HNH endonuclease [Mycolicibacterium sphagni]|uniref:Restriction endonuclease n=1 Tax=Mycolicibacterium sphagni TaxID=1786 RepID=A0A255DCB1_9MYCO|nr:HNH endonuclease [Mycolicibacterium sphagni]MCV7177393.1 HNH endonuclease [Mycolicibacterium sphagni]OYN77077.1 restriction endonuclease [Mycolicibacterium sphagni]
MNSEVELELRRMLFEHLSAIADERGVVTRADLESITIGGRVYKAVDRNSGIWNPGALAATLSVISDPASDYDDGDMGDSLFSYAYEKTSENGRNVKMRRALDLQLPILLLRKIENSVFVPVFPVYVVSDDRPNRRFILALDESLRFVADPLHLRPVEQRYAERAVKLRLHQPEFRGRILTAYQKRCTVCTLRHGKLLDAAHIIGDTKPHGLPIIENGLSLCKIHHAAYDANLLGISPDYVVRINCDLMEEVDGPMLQHGLQEMDGRALTLPPRRADRPSKDRLAERFDEFRAAD